MWSRFGGLQRRLFSNLYDLYTLLLDAQLDRVEEVQELDIVMVRGGLRAIETVPISYISRLIGRIKSSDDRGKIIYLTRNCLREQDSVDK